MKMNPRFLVIPALVVGLQAATAADITGTITLNGKPPEEKIIDMSSIADCSKQHPEPVKTQFYVVGPKGELKDVIISIKNLSGKSTGESAEPLVLDQKGCEYSPYVTAVQTGQKILVKNSDPVFHNVDVIPTKEGNKPANKAQGPGAPDIAMSFSAEESFLRFKCDVHPWMFAYVSIIDNPYFAVSDKDGKFKIANVPAGKYTLEAAHRKAGKVTKEIEVKADGAVVDFTMELPK
ncbi:MAG TPA: carboxypeptidase regulatory-like domain-containing protein [Verrucomicrobiae bacterium]|jgi:plastocyanin|nr:carboxypeptidase regulatory-like domain-containing protein [Verrucomicrobiae bacterium]